MSDHDSRANSTALFLDAMAQRLAQGVSKDEAHDIVKRVYDRGFDDNSYLLDKTVNEMRRKMA